MNYLSSTFKCHIYYLPEYKVRKFFLIHHRNIADHRKSQTNLNTFCKGTLLKNEESVKKPPYMQGHLILQVNTVPVIRTDMVMVHHITYTKGEEKNNTTILTRSILQHVLNLQRNTSATNSERF